MKLISPQSDRFLSHCFKQLSASFPLALPVSPKTSSVKVDRLPLVQCSDSIPHRQLRNTLETLSRGLLDVSGLALLIMICPWKCHI